VTYPTAAKPKKALKNPKHPILKIDTLVAADGRWCWPIPGGRL